jgi:hypothetical protein
VVFHELFSSGGAEIYFRKTSHYGLAQRKLTFAEIPKEIALHGEIAIGVQLASQSAQPNMGIIVNPQRDEQWLLSETDKVIILTTYA